MTLYTQQPGPDGSVSLQAIKPLGQSGELFSKVQSQDRLHRLAKRSVKGDLTKRAHRYLPRRLRPKWRTVKFFRVVDVP